MVRIGIDKIRKFLGYRRRLVAYIISGVGSLAVDYTTFITFYYVFHLPIAIAAPLGLSAGLVSSFMLNKLWTFKGREKTSKKQTVIQATLYMILFLFNNLFTIYFIKALLVVGVSVAIGKLVATGIITLWNYLTYKNIIFS